MNHAFRLLRSDSGSDFFQLMRGVRGFLAQFSSAYTRRHATSIFLNERRFVTAAIPDGPAVTETNRKSCHLSIPIHHSDIFIGAQATLRRFWKTVGIDKRGDAFAVTLDKRPLKTPAGNTLLLPGSKGLLATLIAQEWETQEILLKPHALPMVLISLSMRNVMALITCSDIVGIESY